ncbi:MAG: hypothetical protein FWF58_03505, partial [Firmicutes bacterium]|nr:hypothetical protein [Bacillota bacterium]
MFLKNITKYQVQKYTIKAMGASAVVVAIVGAILISNTTLTSYSDMFYVHRQYFAWVLSLLGIVLIWCRVEVGVGFVMLAVFDTGDIHNY